MIDYQKQIITAVKKVMPAVVSVIVAKDLKEIAADLPEEFYNLDPREQAFLESKLRQAPRDEHGRIKVGGGSGFLITKNGLILTNKHVIADPKADYSVITYDGKKHETKILARDPINDVAILKIDSGGKELPAVELGTAKNIELGQTVVAIGNALGEFQNSVSTGVVSGLSRLITAITDPLGHQQRLRGLIQTDAAINPGNSGGPLVDIEGRAIGINSAVVFGAQNIGFAIPIDQAEKDLEEIKKYGHIRRPFFGVRYMILNKSLQEKFNLPIDHGALIMNEGMPGDTAVVPGSAAEKAGLQEYDVILAFNKKNITEEETLEDLIASCKIGDKIDVEVLRNGKKLRTKIVLEEFLLHR
ncbi:MAG: trypsin-like peptidase domain-containing protein [Candidatus Niyogibacteria bacterium]|nr:MAG: trypsin-like peptidase domain-containing protein [Candidatus Niyogibacteria bacterium]